MALWLPRARTARAVSHWGTNSPGAISEVLSWEPAMPGPATKMNLQWLVYDKAASVHSLWDSNDRLNVLHRLYNKCKPQKSHLEELESPATQQEESALPPYLNSHWLNHWTNRSQLGMASVILHFDKCWGPNRRTTHVAIDGGPVHVQLAMMSSLHDLTKNIKYQKAHKAPKIKKAQWVFYKPLKWLCGRKSCLR